MTKGITEYRIVNGKLHPNIGAYPMAIADDGSFTRRDIYYANQDSLCCSHSKYRPNALMTMSLRFKEVLMSDGSSDSGQPFVVFVDDNDRTYPMFLQHFSMIAGKMIEGRITGEFVGFRRFGYYGIAPVLGEND